MGNALALATVYSAMSSKNGDRIAYTEIDHDDTGVAIGKDGRNIEDSIPASREGPE